MSIYETLRANQEARRLASENYVRGMNGDGPVDPWQESEYSFSNQQQNEINSAYQNGLKAKRLKDNFIDNSNSLKKWTS